MIEIELPDGTVAEFPEGTPHEAIQSALQKRFSAPKRGFQVLDKPLSETLDAMNAPQPAPEMGGWDAFKRGFSDMATFGTADEVTGAINSLISGDSYANERDELRAGLEQAREQRPATTLAGGLTGGVLQGLFTAGLGGGTAAATTGQRALQGAKMGAIEGGLYGAGSGEGTLDRLGDAAKFGAMGGVVGGVAPWAIEGGRRAIRGGITNPLSNITNTASPTRASEAIYNGLRRGGMTADEAQAAIERAVAEGQPEFALADAMGRRGGRMLNGIARQAGEGSDEIAANLSQRQLDQPDRMAGFVQDAYGFRGASAAAQGTDLVPAGHQFMDTSADILRRPVRSAASLTEDLTAARGTAADAAYTAAREGASPVDVRGALAAIDERIGPMQGSGVAGDGIDAKLAGYRSRLAANPPGARFDGADAVELSDFDRVLGVKQAIQDDIGAAVRAGRNNEARELGKIATRLDEALEAGSAGYRKANDDFREASRVIDAVSQGADMSKRGNRAVDTTAQFGRMNTDQQGAARIGYGDRVLANMEAGAAPTTNRAKPFGSQKMRQEAQAMTIDPDLFARRVQRENDMWETFNRTMGGSRTADNLEDVSAMGDMARGVLGNLLAGRLLEAGKQAGVKGVNMVSGQSEATRSLIAQMLLSQSVPEAIAPTLKALTARTKYSLPIEALMRSGGRMIQDHLSK